jgi:hypothetical protein
MTSVRCDPIAPATDVARDDDPAVTLTCTIEALSTGVAPTWASPLETFAAFTLSSTKVGLWAISA